MTSHLESNYRRLRFFCWLVLLALGAAQAWATRFTMNPDGISYLDIGDAYWHGDWHNAINAYWSPLYSWILGLFLKVLRPSAYWEYPVVHLVNFLIYVAALLAFDFFLREFILEQNISDDKFEVGLPIWCWWVVGYAIFASSCLLLITLGLATPDMCVAGFVFLVCGLLLRIRRGQSSGTTFGIVGGLLGVAYLAKAVMFPLAFVFITVAFILKKPFGKAWGHAAIAVFVFVLITGPLVLALSRAKGRVTFGDSGPITYEIFVNKVDIFAPTSPALAHLTSQISDVPFAQEFREPIKGTYPLWYDPTYWHEGIKPRFALIGEFQMVKYDLMIYLVIIGSIFLQLNLSFTLFLLYFLAPSPASCLKTTARFWPLFVPASIALAAYLVVYTEFRYVCPFVAILWMVLFSGVRLPSTFGMRRFIAVVIVFTALATLLVVSRHIFNDWKDPVPAYWQAASAMRSNGLVPGDKIAVISKEPFGTGGAFVARLARVQIIAQTRETEKVINADSSSRARLFEAFSKTGSVAILADFPIPDANTCWKRLDNTQYSICSTRKAAEINSSQASQ